MIGSGAEAAMLLLNCRAACVCGRCGGSELVGTYVTLCAASGISVLDGEPWEKLGWQYLLNCLQI